MRAIVVIPVRYGSSRFPGKPLARETGKYLVQHVYERARAAPGEPYVAVLTDDDRVEEAVRSFGGTVVRTRGDHRSGTDRCAEAAASLDQAVVVNVQADEPLFEPADLARLVAAVAAGADIATLGHPFADPAREADPNAVKALSDANGWAVGFQRAAPDAAARAGLGDPAVTHHVGIYAFRRDRLLAFPDLPPTEGERRERLEQLRALEHGWRIRVLPASAAAFGIDTRADYDAFLAQMRVG